MAVFPNDTPYLPSSVAPVYGTFKNNGTLIDVPELKTVAVV